MPRGLRKAGPLKRGAVVVAATATSVFAPFYLARWHWHDSELLAMMLAWLWAIVTLMIVPSHTARAIIQERLQGTWDAVVITRLQPTELFLGKLLAPLIPVWLVGLFFLPACLLFAASADSPYGASSALALVGVAYGAGTIGGLAFGALGLYASMRCSSIWSAQLWTYIPMIATVSVIMAAVILR